MDFRNGKRGGLKRCEEFGKGQAFLVLGDAGAEIGSRPLDERAEVFIFFCRTPRSPTAPAGRLECSR